MDVYRALNADVPHLLFTVLHQTGPMISSEDFTRTAIALHMEMRQQSQQVGNELHQWLQQQSSQQAEETIRKLQRSGMLSEQSDPEQLQEILLQDFERLSSRIGSESLVGMQGSGEVVLSEEIPANADLARLFIDGREYVATLGFKPGQGIMHESWLLFRSSLHYDIMEHVVRDRMGIYKGSHGDHIISVARTSFGTYNLVYQLGEMLTAEQSDDNTMQEVTLAFSKGPVQYSPFRLEVAALIEQVAPQIPLMHASFWQRKLGLGTGKEFMLRLRIPTGETALQEVLNAITNAGDVGKKTIMKRGKLLLGKRVL